MSAELNITPSTELHPAPLCGRADPDQPPWVAAGPAAGHRADGGGRAVADALTVQGVLLNPACQEELFNPGRDVSINPDYNPILTPQRTVPYVRLGDASTGQCKIIRGEGAIAPDVGIQDVLQCATRHYRYRTGAEDSQMPVRNSDHMAVESRGDLASRHGSIVRIAAAHSWSYRSDNPVCTRTPSPPPVGPSSNSLLDRESSCTRPTVSCRFMEVATHPVESLSAAITSLILHNVDRGEVCPNAWIDGYAA